jgi:hypothetical protein
MRRVFGKSLRGGRNLFFKEAQETLQKGIKGFRDFEGQPSYYFLAKAELVFQLATTLLDAYRVVRSLRYPK